LLDEYDLPSKMVLKDSLISKVKDILEISFL